MIPYCLHLWLCSDWETPGQKLNTMDLKCMLCVDMLGKIFLFSVSVKQKKKKKKALSCKTMSMSGEAGTYFALKFIGVASDYLELHLVRSP